MDKEPSGRFEVIDHYELSGRGGFVIGHVREGIVNIGDSVPLPDSSACWTISGVEFIDNIAEQKSWNALIFDEQPSKADVQAAFPFGSYIEIYEGGGEN